jgi:hypothetical protein
MRIFSWIVLLAPLALAACGSDERPIVVNSPPAATPNTTVVPAPAEPPVVVVPRR